MLQDEICEQIKPFPFYSLQQFEYQQLISRSKYSVASYLHIESKIIYVVKQIPFDQKKIALFRKLEKMNLMHIVNIYGICLLKHKSNKNIESHRMKNECQKQHQSIKDKDHSSILLFMEKCQMNLHEYVISRRKKLQFFKKQQITNFIMQMLGVLQKLQKQGIAHRDLKPENILYNKGLYYLCDFDDMVITLPNQKPLVDLTTVAYSSPEFLRYIRQNKKKDKFFDPYKLDLYSFGLTLMFVCSMGKFSLEQRSSYIYDDNSTSHFQFIQEQRRKLMRENNEYQTFNSIFKILFQQDQYKRDDFVSFSLKIKYKIDGDRALSQQNNSEDSSNKNSLSQLKQKKQKKLKKIQKINDIQSKHIKIYKILNIIVISVLIFLFIF